MSHSLVPIGVGLEAGLVPAGTYAGCWRADKNPEEIERKLKDRAGAHLGTAAC